MNRTLYVVSTSLFALFALGLAGCKVSACPDTAAADGGTDKPVNKDNCIQLEPTVEYDGTPRTANPAWSTGMGVSVANHNGGLTITSDSTSPTEVQVSGIPFTRDGTSDAEKQAATQHISAMPAPSVTTDATGVTIDAYGKNFDGYKLTVRLPAGFDGVLKATADNGQLSYSGTPASTGNSLASGNGDVTATIGTGANVTATAKTDFGTVVFRGPWTMPMLSSDQSSGTATLGTGAATIEGTTKNGDVLFNTP
jgi:hypothetical protein